MQLLCAGALLFGLCSGTMADAAEQDCAAILAKMSFQFATADAAHADGPTICRYDNVLFQQPVGATPPPYRYGFVVDQLTVETPDWSAIDTRQPPPSVSITAHGVHYVLHTTRPATDFMINTAAARFDGTLTYRYDAASGMAGFRLDASGRRLGTLHAEVDFHQIDLTAINGQTVAPLGMMQLRRAKLHFENVGLVEGFLWSFLAPSLWSNEDPKGSFDRSITQARLEIAKLVPGLGGDSTSVDALTRIAMDFPRIERPIDAEIVFKEPAALVVIAGVIEGSLPLTALKTEMLKVSYGP